MTSSPPLSKHSLSSSGNMMKPDSVLITPFLGLGRVGVTFPTTFFLQGTAAAVEAAPVLEVDLSSLGGELGEVPLVTGTGYLTTNK